MSIMSGIIVLYETKETKTDKNAKQQKARGCFLQTVEATRRQELRVVESTEAKNKVDAAQK